MGVYGHHQPTRPTDKSGTPKPDVQLDDRHMPVNPTEHDESDEIEQQKRDESALFEMYMNKYDQLNATGTFLTLLWDFRWFSLPVLMIALYEPIYWTLLNLWCWLYGIFY